MVLTSGNAEHDDGNQRPAPDKTLGRGSLSKGGFRRQTKSRDRQQEPRSRDYGQVRQIVPNRLIDRGVGSAETAEKIKRPEVENVGISKIGGDGPSTGND